MKSFKILFLFSVILLCNACTPQDGMETAETKRADSLVDVLNSPALKVINKKILNDANNPSLYNERAIIYLNLKQLTEAINDAKRAVKIDSNKVDFYLTEADIFFAANETRNAKETLEKIVRRFPENTDGLLKLGELYFYVKQYENAFAAINKALKINQNLAKAYLLKGNIYRETGDTAKAISSLETAIDQDNRNYNAFLDMGIIYGARKNTIALEYYDNAIRIKPTAEALYAKAKLLQDLDKMDDAIKLYTEVLKIDPLHEHAMYNIGAIELQVKKDAATALDYFSRAILVKPQYAEAYFARGVCYDELKNKNSAYEDYNKCLQLKPNYEPAVDALNALGKVK